AVNPNIGVDLTLEDLTSENNIAVFHSESHTVGNKRSTDSGRKLGREIAYLIGVTKQDKAGIELVNYLFRGLGVPIRRVLRELIIFDDVYALELLCGDFGGNSFDRLSEHHRGD